MMLYISLICENLEKNLRKKEVWNFTDQSENPRDYQKTSGSHSSDKESHRERSIGNDSRKNGHRRFWEKKENR